MLFVAVTLSSQTFRLSIEPGYGFYDMTKLHQTQEAAIAFYPGLGIKAAEKFPPFFNQSGSFLWYASSDFLIGFTTGFLSTGGRNSVKDYSGEYKLDMMVNALQYGLETEYNFRLIPKVKCFLNLRGGGISSKLDFKENFIVTNTTLIDNTNKITEKSSFIEPTTGIRYLLDKSFTLKMGIGYLINFNTLKEPDVNWSGCQLKLGVEYSF
jgi:hypothetical protein